MVVYTKNILFTCLLTHSLAHSLTTPLYRAIATMTFDNDHLTVDSARGIDNDELFTTPSTDPIPDRHPSVLRPGGHSSPLKHPSALRPGAARHSRTPSPHSTPASPPPAHPPRASPSPVAYKAYSPPKPQNPSDELSSEIEGYFTALEVAPLRINRTPELPAVATPPLPPKVHDEQPLSPEQRCASPPVPPKESIQVDEERHHAVSSFSELEAPMSRTSQEHVVSPVSEPDHQVVEEEAPPPYEESQPIPPPPEKIAVPNRTNSGSPASAAAASAAHVGSVTAGVPVNEAIASSTAALAAVTIEDPPATNTEPAAGEHDDIYSAGPPPLPPRPTPSPTGKGKDPAIPGAFPPPPSQPSPGYKASGAAATSAAGVGSSIAGVGQSASLKQARKALEKGLGHLIDKAKEHHHAREQSSHERKSSGRKKSPDGTKKSADSSGNVAQVSGARSGLGLGVDADLYY